VRWCVTVLLISLSPATVPAQQQERSLLDRLLRPEMNLQNSAQARKFETKSVAVRRLDAVGTFLPQQNLREKSFDDRRVLSTKQYSAYSFDTDDRAASSRQIQAATMARAAETSTARDIRDSPEVNKTVATRNFADQREFREQGKSQKSLDRRNPPLTIEQVRELLNKNK
jgi:hypothetical protein